MEISGKPIDTLIPELKIKLASEEQKLQEYESHQDVEPIMQNALAFDILLARSGIRMFKEEIMRLELLALTEEKRRLLTNIVEWMNAIVNDESESAHFLIMNLSNDFRCLMVIKENIEQAKTMEELALIGEELKKFKQDHPELEQ